VCVGVGVVPDIARHQEWRRARTTAREHEDKEAWGSHRLIIQAESATGAQWARLAVGLWGRVS
jgi:hypothetical protein